MEQTTNKQDAFSGDDKGYELLAEQLHHRMRVAKLEYIICAANWYQTERKHDHQPENVEQGFVICGRRHHNIFHDVALMNSRNHDKVVALNNTCEQGFLTSKNRWVDRKEAGEIALKAGQITKATPVLFSEDLY